MAQTLAWWLSYSRSRSACVVETRAGADILEAALVAAKRGCEGRGEIRGTFFPARKMESDIPRRLWYRLRTVEQWRAAGIDAETDAVPPGTDPCPLCLVEDALLRAERN